MSIINDVRQHHALEHATIALLIKHLPGNVRLIGRAGLTGFYLYGDVPTEAVEAAAAEALQRVQEGEQDLAVSPMCGTNLVVAGVGAGLASMIASRGTSGLRRFTRVLNASLVAVLLAQPLGRLAQKHLTTNGDLSNISISKVTRKGSGRRTWHKVEVVHL